MATILYTDGDAELPEPAQFNSRRFYTTEWLHRSQMAKTEEIVDHELRPSRDLTEESVLSLSLSLSDLSLSLLIRV